MIAVTKPFFPPLETYNKYLNVIWENQWLTNRGELVCTLEDKLKNFLGVEHMTLTTNGTLPIQIAIKALGLQAEIITTPFSYVATTSSIIWEGCKPVFVDIHPDYLTIDETKIEEAITENTSAILATHVFGNPCAVEEIEVIAKKHNLKVIYDAAHCFGVKYKGQSIFNYGDVSTCSFHATKIFHIHEKLFYHHNFGHFGQENFHGIGINAKMSELQAAMGHAVFESIQDIYEMRKATIKLYQKLLNGKYKLLKLRENTDWNYHYFPIIFDSEEALLTTKSTLNNANIHPRRYFYPSLNKLPYIENNASCPISEEISKRVLCLPLYATEDNSFVEKVTINL